MRTSTGITQKIEDALSSIDNLTPASPAPYFYTRLEARLNREPVTVWDRLGRILARPAFAFATVSLVILVNSFIILSQAPDLQRAESPDTAVMDEYSQSTAYYDLENIQP